MRREQERMSRSSGNIASVANDPDTETPKIPNPIRYKRSGPPIQRGINYTNEVEYGNAVYKKIRDILIKIFEDKPPFSPLFDRQNIPIWASAFTHSSFQSKVDTEDYELKELVGDSIMNPIFIEYVLKLGVNTPEAVTELLHHYMTKEEGGQIQYGDIFDYQDLIRVGDVVRKDPVTNKYHRERIQIDKKIQGDIFESFIGAIYLIGLEGKVNGGCPKPHLSFIYVRRIMFWILKQRKIDMEKSFQGPINILRQNLGDDSIKYVPSKGEGVRNEDGKYVWTGTLNTKELRELSRIIGDKNTALSKKYDIRRETITVTIIKSTSEKAKYEVATAIVAELRKEGISAGDLMLIKRYKDEYDDRYYNLWKRASDIISERRPGWELHRLKKDSDITLPGVETGESGTALCRKVSTRDVPGPIKTYNYISVMPNPNSDWKIEILRAIIDGQ